MILKLIDKLALWLVARQYDEGTREVYNRIYRPTEEDIERFGYERIIQARAELSIELEKPDSEVGG